MQMVNLIYSCPAISCPAFSRPAFSVAPATGHVTFGRRFNSRPWHCPVIAEICNGISQVDYLGIYPPAQVNSALHPSGVANRVPASAGLKTRKSHLPGGR